MLLTVLISAGCGAGLDPSNVGETVKPVAKAPILKDPPRWVMSPCDVPQALPRKELSQKDIEDRWGADADAADECRSKHAILLRYYQKRDKALRELVR